MAAEDISAAIVSSYLALLHKSIGPSTVHQHFRVLRTFFRWAVDAGFLSENPLRGLRVILPKTLPKCPSAEEVRALIVACPETLAGRRLRTIIILLADSGLRVSEALRLRVSDVDLASRTVTIKGGKGQKDGVGYFGERTATMLAPLIESPADALLFAHADGRPFAPAFVTHALHRLSVKAGLLRKYGAHALRHYAATSVLRSSGDLELCRRLLRHSTLTMTLRYATLSDQDVARKYQQVSPVDSLTKGGELDG
jgi:integrase/recombinase XerD